MLRRTRRTRRWQAKLKAVKLERRRRMHQPLPELGAYVRSVVAGHVRYYGVPMNGPPLYACAQAVTRVWWRILARRSHRHLPWHRMQRYVARWIPPVRMCHPYPLVRCGVVTQGRSRMRSCRTSGSVEGATGDHHSYSDITRAPIQPRRSAKPPGLSRASPAVGRPRSRAYGLAPDVPGSTSRAVMKPLVLSTFRASLQPQSSSSWAVCPRCRPRP